MSNDDKKAEGAEVTEAVKEAAEEAQESAQEAEKAEEKAEEAAKQAETAAATAESSAQAAEKVVEEVKEDKKEETPKASVKVSAKLEKVIKAIEELSVLELADLVKALQDRFGVSAAPQVAAVAAPSGQAAPAEGPSEEQTTFNVVLANSGANKISVIKALREINQQLGLKEAKDIADAPPKEILTAVNKSTADEAKGKLEAAGASVELK